MATLKDISAELGVSVATVSRALNGFPEVNTRTRDKVRDAAQRLGYRPNRTAQRLVTGRSGMVGMIVKIKKDMSASQTFFEMLTGLTAALAAREADLVLAVDQGDDPVAPYLRMLERDILDGFILNAPETDDPRAAFLRKRGIPFVMHGQVGDDPDYPFYDIDNKSVSGEAVRLLSALGHKRIALVAGESRYAYAATRVAGFLAAMDADNLHVPPAFVARDATTETNGYTHALAMLSGRHGDRPTAVVCDSTVIAAGVMRAAADLGLNVPGDLSIVAHDDALPMMRAVNFEPALTVTRAPLRDACAPLANKLADLLAGVPAQDLQTLIQPETIVRQSTGPVPQTGKTPWL